jgi:hypothetical protein
LNSEYNYSNNPIAPFYGLKHSDETREKMSDAKRGNINGFKKGGSKPLGSGKSSQSIEVFDNNTNETTTYDSINKAAIALNINVQAISAPQLFC